MAMAYIVVLAVVAVAAAGLVAYGLLQYNRQRTRLKSREQKFEHIQRMAREERDYDEIMAYAERDSTNPAYTDVDPDSDARDRNDH